MLTKINRLIALLTVASSLVSLPSLQAKANQQPRVERFPSAIGSIAIRDLPGNFNGVDIADFAFSPDENKISVEFQVGEDDHHIGTWIAQWTLGNNRLIAKEHLPNTGPLLRRSTATYHPTMQYTPDGSTIIVAADPDLYALDSETLKMRYHITNFEGSSSSASEGLLGELIAVSADGSTLAWLVGQSANPDRLGSISLYKLKSGAKLSRWSLPAHVQSLSLSADGTKLLLAIFNPHDATDILILDAKTGRPIESVQSGFETQLVAGSRLNALFLDENHFVVSPGGETDASGRYLGTALRVFDARTGKITGELTYNKFGPSGELWTSSNGRIVATLDLWASKWRRRFTEGDAKSARLAFFHLDDAHQICRLGPIPERGKESAFMRFSADLSAVGIFMDREITFYRTSQCAGEERALNEHH